MDRLDMVTLEFGDSCGVGNIRWRIVARHWRREGGSFVAKAAVVAGADGGYAAAALAMKHSVARPPGLV